jgi:hypothetical protein
MVPVRVLLAINVLLMLAGCGEPPAPRVVPIATGKAKPAPADNEAVTAPGKQIPSH